MEHGNVHETTFRDVLRVIFKHKYIIFAVIVVIMSTVYIGLQFRTPLYQASVRMLVTGQMQKDIEYFRSMSGGSITKTAMILVSSKPILERTVKALKLDKVPLDYESRFATKLKRVLINRNVKEMKKSLDELTPEQRDKSLLANAVGELSSNIEVSPEGDETSIFNISVTAFNPNNAAIIANVLSRSYVIYDIEQQIAQLQLIYGEKNSTIMKLEHHIKRLEESLDGRLLPDIEAIGPASTKIIGQAISGQKIPEKPSSSAVLFLALIVSVTTGIMLSFGFEYLSQTFKSPQDIQAFLNLRFLGSIPARKAKEKQYTGHFNQNSIYNKSFQGLSDHISVLMKDKKMKSLLIVDAEGSEETASIVSNIGSYLAQKADNKVLIIDTDLRHPSISKIFNVTNTPNLIDVLEGKISFTDAVQSVDHNLFILTSDKSPFNPISLLESSAMSDITSRALELYDFIFINCVDLKEFRDAVILSNLVDGTAIVVGEDKARKQIVKNAVNLLAQKKVNILGVILNNRKYVLPKIIYDLT